jgi:hypothetical protein
MFWGVSFIVANALMDDFYGSQAALDVAHAKGGAVVLLTGAAWVLVTMGLIAPSVGYRRRDAFFMLVPLYSYAFGVKMLWRWTALPDRYWDRTGGVVVDSLAEADAGRRRAWRPADPFIAIMCVVALGLVVAMANRDMLTTSDETVTARGLAIVVPPGYYVTTDPTEAARIMSESGGVFDERFEDSFVMLAIEPARAGESWITIFREPSPTATLFATARDYVWYLEQSGVFVSNTATVVGTGPYPAARIEWRSGRPGEPPGPTTSFVIDDGARIWEVIFWMPAGEDASLARLVDRTMETLELP